MDSLPASIGNSDSTRNANFSYSKLITYGFALAIIIGLGALAVGGVGLGGYLHESLGSLSQNHAFIMMVTCFISGAVLLIIGIVGSIIHYRKNNLQQREDEIPSNNLEANNVITEEEDLPPEVHPFMKNNPKINCDVIRTLDTHNGLIYGQGAWKYWGLEVTDKPTEPPKVEWNAHDPHFNEPYSKNYVLLYIPKNIRVIHTGEEQTLTVATFEKNSKVVKPQGCSWTTNYMYFDAKEFKDCRAPGWVLLSTRCIPESLENQNLEPTGGFRIPDLLEIMVLIQMVKAFTGKELYKEHTQELSRGNCSMFTKTRQQTRYMGDYTTPLLIGCGSPNFHPFSVLTMSSKTCGVGAAESL